MDIFSIIVIGIGLSMDSFAVSITNGLTISKLTITKIFLIAFSLSFFQSIMPTLGWLAGIGIISLIKNIDHWLAFSLLTFIGLKMIYESTKSDENMESGELKFMKLIVQSFATSIDSFVVGLSFALLDSNSIIRPILIIGVITFIFSVSGLILGKYFGSIFGKKAEIFGGIILIFIGIKILIEHLFF